MKTLVVGSGGREHALLWRMSRNPDNQLFAMPGNPGIASCAECIPSFDLSPKNILTLANSIDADLTIIGPEAPLVAGVVDLFRASGRPIVGPTAAAAQLEGSKIYSKNFFSRHKIPTADYIATDSREDAMQALDRFPLPVVIKADGLAAGKGVVIASTRTEAEKAIQTLGPKLVIEEFLTGPEISFIVLSDGQKAEPLLPSRDHKKLFNYDKGPNTGGMGAICSAGLVTAEDSGQIMETIIMPTLHATRFTGFLYAGLILTQEGPRLLEYNVRLGDPEAQAILHQMQTDPVQTFFAAAHSNLSGCGFQWKPGASVCLVLAAAGYPERPSTGDAIQGIWDAEALGATVFHAGTQVGWAGPVTGGGRVLGVTATGTSVEHAAHSVYQAVEKIRFDGMHYRQDIGRHYDKETGT